MVATGARTAPGAPGGTRRPRTRASLVAVAVSVTLAAALAACSTTPGAPAATGTARPPATTHGTSGPAGGGTATLGTPTTPEHPGTTSSSPTVPPQPAPEECARTLVHGMSPSERAGQLLMVGLDVGAGRDSIDRLVASRHLGGVVLLGGWYGGAAAARAATSHLDSLTRGSEPRLFIAADQEGGNVQQLRGAGFTRIPTARVQNELSPEHLSARVAGWAAELRRAGVNLNLAPVADTVPAELGTANAPIGHWDRQFSSDPVRVGRMVAASVEGMHRGGVAATVKHFPGIGRITGNTDLTDRGITDGTTTATDSYLRPFAQGIRAGADLVMVGSAIYSRIDPKVNAVFSSAIVTGLLRHDLGYQGVVITDDVGAAQALSATPVGERATRFVDAGGDIVLTARPGTVATMHDALVGRMGRSATFAREVEAAATRVLTLKVERGLASCD